MSSRDLLLKARRALSDGGVGDLAKKTKNYLIFKIKAGTKKSEVKDILFINGCTLPHPSRYRVEHQKEQLESCGLTADTVLYTQLKPEIVKYYRAIIVFRCPITPEVEDIIKRAHHYNKKVFFDVDDLVIDKKYTDTIPYVQKMSDSERQEYDDGVNRMGETMKLCDYCITTTPALRRELKKYNKEVFVNPNVASEEMVKLSLNAAKRVENHPDEIILGYLSGSITHNPDFELIKPAIIRILNEFSNVKLCVVGLLDIPEDLKPFEDRVITKPFIDWRDLPEIIASLDINLAPIEESVFNEAKSENKWTEAALCKVVTAASNFGAFKNAIKDGKTGMLCNNSQEWYRKLKQLIEDPDLRQAIAENAHQQVLKQYITTYTGQGLMHFIESKLARNIAFVLPSSNISGGVNVVLKHCEILRQHGWDASVISMDVDDRNIISDDGEINCVSSIKHDIAAKYDTLVATLYTTLKFIKTYPNVHQRCYLVQNFETDFNDYGSHVKREANSTYLASGIKYLTISKWCQNWLTKDYNQKVKYAPNGIDPSQFPYRERQFNQHKIKILIEGNSDDYYKNVDESFKIVEQLDFNRYEVTYLSYQGKPKEWYHVDKFYNRVPHSQVGEIYRQCDILLKTSILESFSYPPLEMMATGGYVVAVPNDGNLEYLKDSYNCLFYQQGNIKEAVEKIEQIVDNPKLRRKLDIGARKTVASSDWRDIEKQIIGLYQ